MKSSDMKTVLINTGLFQDSEIADLLVKMMECYKSDLSINLHSMSLDEITGYIQDNSPFTMGKLIKCLARLKITLSDNNMDTLINTYKEL